MNGGTGGRAEAISDGKGKGKSGKGKAPPKPCWFFHTSTCSRTAENCFFSHAKITNAEKAKLVKPESRAPSPSSWTAEPKSPGEGKGKGKRAARKPDDVSHCFSFKATGKCINPVGECRFPHLTEAEVTTLREKKANAACAIEVCAPATELLEIPRHRNRMHRLACAPVADDVPEINAPVEAISMAAASLGAIPRDAAAQHDFGPISRTDYLEYLAGGMPFSAEFLASLCKNTKVRRMVKAIEDKRHKRSLRFDETQIHPERKTVDPDREQYPCSYLLEEEERRLWETQCKISHKVAAMKAAFVEHIVNGTLVDHW